MSQFSHLVELDKKAGLLKIFRVMPDGTKHLFTESLLPSGLDASSEQFARFSRLLGENILIDLGAI